VSNVLEPVIQLEQQLETAKEKAKEILLKKLDEIDEQLARLGHGKRGRKPKGLGK
jgi:hypothetical protein